MSLISTFTLLFVMYHSPFEFFARYEALIRKSVNPSRGFKDEITYLPPFQIYLIKR